MQIGLFYVLFDLIVVFGVKVCGVTNGFLTDQSEWGIDYHGYLQAVQSNRGPCLATHMRYVKRTATLFCNQFVLNFYTIGICN